MYQPTRLLALSLLIYLASIAYGADPTFPKLQDIATSFETNVELTDQDQETTVIAKEYHDFTDQTSRLEVLAVGEKLTYFAYGKEDQVFTVDDSSCTLDFGGTFELELFYGWTSEKPLHVGPSTLILNAESKNPVFVTETDIRGIHCNQFRSEMNDEKKQIKLFIDYYFSDSKWTMPFKGSKTFPVRVVISYDSDAKLVHQMVDFLYFRPNFNDKAKFQPPVGLGCWGKDPKVPLPVIPKQYGFGAEGFDLLKDENTIETDVLLYRLWYNSKLKAARLDRYTSRGLTADLSDFETGVQYHMHDYRTCRFRPIRNSFFLGFPSDSLIGYMKDPNEVLELQGDFYSLGEAEVRGVKCRVFEKAEKNVTFRDEDYSLLATTVYFTMETMKIQVDGIDVETSVPVAIRVTGYGFKDSKATLKMQFQIFSFENDPEEEFYTTFPIETCFPGTKQKSYFFITIDASEDTARKYEGQSPLFYDIVTSTIMATAKIHALRLPFMKIDYSESGILITGLMLDKPPSLAQFWKEFDEPILTKKTAAFEINFDAADEESCATACIDLKGIKCTGFHFCGQGCFLNTGEITDITSDEPELDLKCYIYIRAVSDSSNTQASLENALKNLAVAIDRQTLTFQSPIEGDDDELVAQRIDTSYNNQGENVNDYPYTLVRDASQLKPESDSETTVEIPDADSEQECYRQCKESSTISCSSFSYCAKATNKMCRISSVVFGGPNDKDEIVNNTNCDIFSMLYLDLFEKFTGKVFLVSGDKSLKSIQSTEECAKNCRQEDSFTCRGFEYCKKKRSCVLHSKHVLDLKPEEYIESQSECEHYSAKFVADYRDLGYLLIDDNSNVRRDINLEECARSCSEEVANCNSFNYCPPTSVGMTDSSCAFTSKTLHDDVATTAKEKCHLFTKREHVNDWTGMWGKIIIEKKGGYTANGFAGLLIGMIIFGLVVGALIFVAYSYYRTRSGGGDGLTVKFSKHDNT